MMHLNLSYDAKVRVKNTGTDIDGIIMRVIGVASRNIFDSYILEFEGNEIRESVESFGQKPIFYKAIVLPEGCLEKI